MAAARVSSSTSETSIREYDRPWSVDAVSILTVEYPQRIYAADVPLKINGWLVALAHLAGSEEFRSSSGTLA